MVWSIDNGYADNLVLCRNGDVGDYSPDNCRWDTQANNMIEARAKMYTLLSPKGCVVDVYNLREHCRIYDLDVGCMSKVTTGKRNYHKGWRLP